MLGVHPLARDVGINVVANLLAAAVIYLVGVAAGVLPYSLFLVIAALLLLMIGSVFATIHGMLQGSAVKEARWALIGRCTVMLIVPTLLVGRTVDSQDHPGPLLADILFAGFLSLIFVYNITGIRQNWRDYIEAQEQALHQQHEEASRNRPLRRRVSREPRIIRRQRLPQRVTPRS
jgi:hypothetical protein